MINDGEDRVVPIGLGEADNEVHGYLLKWEGGGVRGDLVHCWTSAMCDDFVLLARRASLNIFCDPRMHVWPPIIPLGLGNCLVTARVPGYEAFVHDPHDFSLNHKVRRDRQLSFLSPAHDFSLG